MKFQFDPNLDFQQEAIHAVVDLFNGQEACQTNFTVSPSKHDPQQALPGMESDLGIGNRLRLLDEDIHENIKMIQLHNGLAHSEPMGSLDFTVEMETGTGKTYVYLRTIFELNRFIRLCQVYHCGALGGRQGRRLQIAPDDGNPFQGAL